ncbi:RbsD/FucU domain-containing protein [Lentisphaera marina]|uniref:D-ribose pyranase n=1 Tax=Lentisphaera profundi TaxID=1658616 RepID=A0ABY7VNJ6_9BACT|nr:MULTISPECIES: RbsD/FucU domain-containing protein [Lentisphaera]MDD7984648.1 RbsD/FucU domain-containing protein [Lentisphaera marina]WDE95227.1 RbsD/FucU domain-containing protein [Lentisphaera profundi]
MFNHDLLNPALHELLMRVRHTNTIIISDKGFPFWPAIETIDISLADDQPSVLHVLKVILPHFTVGKCWMAEQFNSWNEEDIKNSFNEVLKDISREFEDHDEFKKRVPRAIGLIRTGGTASYSNIILESA